MAVAVQQTEIVLMKAVTVAKTATNP